MTEYVNKRGKQRITLERAATALKCMESTHVAGEPFGLARFERTCNELRILEDTEDARLARESDESAEPAAEGAERKLVMCTAWVKAATRDNPRFQYLRKYGFAMYTTAANMLKQGRLYSLHLEGALNTYANTPAADGSGMVRRRLRQTISLLGMEYMHAQTASDIRLWELVEERLRIDEHQW
jgi:hypothetical protein